MTDLKRFIELLKSFGFTEQTEGNYLKPKCYRVDKNGYGPLIIIGQFDLSDIYQETAVYGLIIRKQD